MSGEGGEKYGEGKTVFRPIMRMPRKGSIDRTDATIRSNDSSCNASLSRGEK